MPTTVQQPPPPTQRWFTVDEYYRMGETGLFGEDDQVELLDGHIYTMSPIGSKHAACVDRLNKLFVLRTGEEAIVRVQNPVRIDETSEPEPDLALLAPRDDDYATRHPGPDDVFVVVEVADASLSFDREVKLPLYAAAGIPEVWLVALDSGEVHVYREPDNDRYRTRETHLPGDDVRVGALSTLNPVPVAAILGKE